MYSKVCKLLMFVNSKSSTIGFRFISFSVIKVVNLKICQLTSFFFLPGTKILMVEEVNLVFSKIHLIPDCFQDDSLISWVQWSRNYRHKHKKFSYANIHATHVLSIFVILAEQSTFSQNISLIEFMKRDHLNVEYEWSY